jgi:anti-sigma factor RsiW
MKTQSCPQAENLIAYLYGEANDEEKKAFESHISSCAICSEELSAFGMVRESVVKWRNEVMSNVITPAFLNPVIVNQERKSSAIAAIREFFTLSPVWLQGATAFAALALIALIVFAAIQLIGNKGNQQMADGNKNSVATSPIASPKDTNKNQNDKIANNAPSQKEQPVQKDENIRNDRSSAIAMKPKGKTPRLVKRVPRLKDEEIFENQMAYNEDDDSLHLSSLNPNE